MADLRLALVLALLASVHGLRLPDEDKSTVTTAVSLADEEGASVQEQSTATEDVSSADQDRSDAATEDVSAQEGASVQDQSAATADVSAQEGATVQDTSGVTTNVSSTDQDASNTTSNVSVQEGASVQDQSNITADATDASASKRSALDGSPEWDYFPPEPHLAIVTGGVPEEYEPGNFGNRGAEILMRYARRKGYALYVERDITRYTDRKPSWGKLPLMSRLLNDAPDVPLFVWIDSDVVPSNIHFSMEMLIRQAACNGNHQSRWEKYFPAEVQDDTFLWLGADKQEGSKDQYLVNSASGIMALRNNPTAKEFMMKVWKVGDLSTYEMQNQRVFRKQEGQQEAGGPFEQGAIWDVLAANPKHFMTKTCLAPAGKLFSLTYSKWLAMSAPLQRLYNMPLDKKNEIVNKCWNDLGINATGGSVI